MIEKNLGWVGFQKSYVIFRVCHGKCLRLLTRWVGGVKKGQNNDYVIFEWSQKRYGNDVRVIFDQWPNLNLGFDVESKI